jgi:hypothetical protein
MTRQHNSFLLRCWTLRDGQERIEIEHIQSGERTRLSSLAAVMEWIGARSSADQVEDGVSSISIERLPESR